MVRAIIAVGFLGLLVGCSDGGSGRSDTSGGSNPRGDLAASAKPSAWEGLWHGTATDTKSGKTTTATAFIDRFGQTQLIVFPFAPILEVTNGDAPAGAVIAMVSEPYFVVQADACCESSFTGQANVRTLGGSTATAVELKGAVAANKLSGSFDYASGSYTFDLEAQPDYLQPLTLQDLAGVYSNIIGAEAAANPTLVTESFVVANDGTVTGSSVLGCIYNGKISIPDTTRHLYRIHLQVDNCSVNASPFVRNGEYDGLGIIQSAMIDLDGVPTQETILVYSLIGPVWLGTRGVVR